MDRPKIPSRKAQAEIVKLGHDLSIARKHRRFTQQRVADGASVSVATIRRLERGDPGVSLGVFAMVLLTLGESGRLSRFMDISNDDIALVLSASSLPKRVRDPRRKKSAPGPSDSGPDGSDVTGTDYEPIAF